MTVTVYRSTDTSAPVLSGSAGALVGVLDAVLVNGYGSQSAAGWAIAFTGTNTRSYRAASGNRLYFDVDDTGTTNARCRGFETASAINTGTGQFPTTAQISGGLYILKSSAADANARPWIVIATATMFYMFINQSNVAAGSAWASGIYSFGDFTSYKSGDTYNTRITGNINTTNSSTNNHGTRAYTTCAAGSNSGHYVPRIYAGTGTSIIVSQLVNSLVTGSPTTLSNGVSMGSSTDTGGAALNASYTYPNAPDGGLEMSRIYVGESTNAIRGYLPGLWCPGFSAGTPPAFGDTWTGTGDLSGLSFELVLLTNGSATARIALETSNTW